MVVSKVLSGEMTFDRRKLSSEDLDEGVPGRGNGQCKDPEGAMSSARSVRRKATVAEQRPYPKRHSR